MSKAIARLLDEPEHMVTKAIAKLEAKNGYPSHDVRLLAENIQKIRTKIADLGLDPDDTTGPELYHALVARFQSDSKALEERLGISRAGFNSTNRKAIELIKQTMDLPEQWALKTAAAKNILRGLPPKRLMKRLNYRSVESLLKRENVTEIYLAASLAESAGWQKNQAKLIAKLDSTNFEPRPLKLVAFDYQKWLFVPEPPYYVVQSNHMAAFGLWPGQTDENMPLLTMISLLLDKLDEYKDLKIATAAAGLDPVVAWWAGLDHLLADIDGEVTSFNLKDVALNSWHGELYADRQTHGARQAFWQELLSRYEHLEPAEILPGELNLLKIPKNQPAYEFVEDI